MSIPENGYAFVEKDGISEIRIRWANPYRESTR